MLTELTIRNFAIIDTLKIAFMDGLNILTGETGAGKSIIIGAVSLLLGDRASGDMIRTSEESALVEAFFDLQGKEPVINMLRGWGCHDGYELVIRRIISRSGKNRVYINGNAATLGMLSHLGESLINICGQHEHQALLNEDNHIEILDEFGGLLHKRREYAAVYHETQLLKDRMQALETLNRRKEERQEFIQFQLKEIVEADPKSGEDDRLAEEKKIMSNVRKLSDLAVTAHDVLYSGEGALLEKLQVAQDAIREIRRIDPGLATSEEDFASLYYQIEEVAFTLRDYAKGLSVDPARLEAVDDRLESLGRLKRKYGGSLETVLSRKMTMEEELKQIHSAEDELDLVKTALNLSQENMEQQAVELSTARRASALILQQSIEKEIHTLHMAGARFVIVFTDKSSDGEGDRFNPRGIDDIIFHISTNQGEALKPLNRVASGGELSRIVLAMKKVLTGAGFFGTIVFDEVDSGIGGATAEIVGEKIRDVAGHNQVICITHLPQIACFGDRHYRVDKRVEGEKTVTRVEILNDKERLEEMARMLGGVDVTETARKHAREMLETTGKGMIKIKLGGEAQCLEKQKSGM